MQKILRHGFLIALTAVFFMVLFTGCAKKGARSCTISGKVTLDGKPIQEGGISFQPVEKGDLPSGAMIVNGKYETDVTPGKKKVVLNATDGGSSEEYSENDPGTLAQDIIPTKYLDDPPIIDVKKSGTFDFELTSD